MMCDSHGEGRRWWNHQSVQTSVSREVHLVNRGGHDACVMCAHTNLLLLLLLATVVTYSEPVGISNVCTVEQQHVSIIAM